MLGDDFYMYNNILTEHTTMRDLLSHATGIPDNFIPLMAILPESLTREELAK